MSWTNDIRCLYCDAKLPLYRKITSGQFCSTSHCTAYGQEQERLAVERLHQTHNSLHAHRPPRAIKDNPVPEFGGLIPLALKFNLHTPGSILADDPLAIEITSLIHSPSWRFQNRAAHGLSMAILVPPDISIGAVCLGRIRSEPRALECVGSLSVPQGSALRIQRDLMFAGPMALALAGKILAAAPELSAVGEATPLDPRVQLRYPAYIAIPPKNEELVQLHDEQVPHADKLLSLPRPTAREGTNRIAEDAMEMVPIFTNSLPQFPSYRRNEQVLRAYELLSLPRPGACEGMNRIAEDAMEMAPIFTNSLPQFPSYRRNEQVLRAYELLSLPRPGACEGINRIAGDAGQTMPIFTSLPPQFPASRRHEPVPHADKLLVLPRPAACEGMNRIAGDAGQTMPIFTSLPPQFPAASAGHGPAPITLMQAGLSRLFIDHFPLVQGAWIDNLRAVELGGGAEVPPFMLATPSRRPRLGLATSSRCLVKARESKASALTEVEPAGFSTASPRISLPPANAQRVQSQIPTPGVAGLLPLTLAAGGVKPSTPAPRLSLPVPQPLSPEPIRPGLKLEPLDALPPEGIPAIPAEIIRRTHVWAYTAAIPVILGLALYSWVPKASGGIPHAFESAVNSQFQNVRRTVLERAAVALDEDFRAGLDEWSSREGASADWSFDSTGFVRPGPLALYRPSLSLRDYQMQFLGLIDKKALSWVVRAADFRNYYVVKLVVLKAGPLSKIGVIRYAVVNGRADSRVEKVAVIDARPDTLYRVRMDVRGDTFLLTVQGQIVDDWSEPRLKHGGVGFFSGAGEASRVRWVQVTHQYDVLGRLCAYLAPYDFK